MCADAKSHNYMYNAYADFNMLHRPEIFEKYEPDSFSFLFLLLPLFFVSFFAFTAAPTLLLFSTNSQLLRQAKFFRIGNLQKD